MQVQGLSHGAVVLLLEVHVLPGPFPSLPACRLLSSLPFVLLLFSVSSFEAAKAEEEGGAKRGEDHWE